CVLVESHSIVSLSFHSFPPPSPPTYISSLSLHDALPIFSTVAIFSVGFLIRSLGAFVFGRIGDLVGRKYTFLITLSGMRKVYLRSEEHTSELQSLAYLVCRLLLEKKKTE